MTMTTTTLALTGEVIRPGDPAYDVARLRQVKAAHHPHNVFTFEQSILLRTS